MRNKIFGLFVIALLVLGVYLLNGKEDILFLENRRAKNIDSISIESIKEGELDDQINEVISDQFYYRDDLITYYYQYKLKVNGWFGEEQKQVISDEIKILDDGYLIKNLNDIDWDQAINSATDRGYNFRHVFDSFPGIKAYVYVPTNIVETNLVNDEKYTSRFEELDKAFTFQTRRDIKFKRLELNSLEDFEKYYFKYDIHWNIDGAYQGYKDIINMINEDFDIGEPKEIKNRITSDFWFKGSNARKIGNAVDGYDFISDVDLGIKDEDYTFYIDGVRTYLNSDKKHYLEYGSHSKETEDVYLQYFGGLGLIKEFDFNQEDKPNLLVFGDSYVNPIQEALASHFNKTIFVDLRFNENEEFDTYKIMEDYDIDIILNLEYYEDLYINGYCFIPINY